MSNKFYFNIRIKKELLTKFPNSNITEVLNYIISSSAEKSLNFINYNNRIFKTWNIKKWSRKKNNYL